jgi:hypothetical protein
VLQAQLVIDLLIQRLLACGSKVSAILRCVVLRSMSAIPHTEKVKDYRSAEGQNSVQHLIV